MTGALGGGWCVSAAEVCPVLTCSDSCQGSSCEGFRGRITGQSALLGSKGGAGTWAFLQGCPAKMQTKRLLMLLYNLPSSCLDKNVGVPRAK